MDASSFVMGIILEMSGARSVGLETRIFHDLHLAGDDVWEVLETIHQEFGTDFSALEFGEYFPDETEALGAHWMLTFGFKSRRRPITVRHLIEVVEHGAWFDPPA